MPQSLLQVGTAEAMVGLLQPRGQHPLVGQGEFARTLLAEEHLRPQRRHRQ